MAEDAEADVEDSLEDNAENLLEEDEIDDREEGFMKGYDDVDQKEESDDIKEEDTSGKAEE